MHSIRIGTGLIFEPFCGLGLRGAPGLDLGGGDRQIIGGPEQVTLQLHRSGGVAGITGRPAHAITLPAGQDHGQQRGGDQVWVHNRAIWKCIASAPQSRIAGNQPWLSMMSRNRLYSGLQNTASGQRTFSPLGPA